MNRKGNWRLLEPRLTSQFRDQRLEPEVEPGEACPIAGSMPIEHGGHHGNHRDDDPKDDNEAKAGPLAPVAHGNAPDHEEEPTGDRERARDSRERLAPSTIAHALRGEDGTGESQHSL